MDTDELPGNVDIEIDFPVTLSNALARAKFTFLAWPLSQPAGVCHQKKVSTTRTEVEALADELETQRSSNREEL